MLPGFKFLLGLGLFGGSRVAEIAKPKEYGCAPNDMAFMNKYRGYYEDLRVNKGLYGREMCTTYTDVTGYAPYTWPKYLYLHSGTTTWKELAGAYNTTVDQLQREYFKWACERDGVPYSNWLFDRVYFRRPNDDVRFHVYSYKWDPEEEKKNRARHEARIAKQKAEEEAELAAKRARDKEILAKREAAIAARHAEERKESKK